ncbi:MAG TPA: hypothetical protein VMV92_44495 [Streptosporangiaceae bacterium]|nr:hypothetical protein [Streptosporangiaceae bacterium]
MTARSSVWAPRRRGDVAASFVVRAAGAAPSVHNTQPWYFSGRENVIRLHADPRRGMPQADPAGREMLISCGAALFNLRLAVRQLGFAAEVTLLPDPSRPDLLAEIRWGWFAPPSPEEEALYQSIPLRHTHRGPFTAGMSPTLTVDLVRIARQEQAGLRVIYDTDQHRPLADLIRVAEYTQRTCPRLAAERVRWARPPGDPRRDGVPPSAYPIQPDGLEFATRDFACSAGWGHAVSRRPDSPHALGVVALLSTREDRRLGWLLAGQALQRLLLHATAHGVSAAFHTQPLELPWTRERIRTEFTGGAYPQMLLRLGCGGHPVATPRRPVADTLS